MFALTWDVTIHERERYRCWFQSSGGGCMRFSVLVWLLSVSDSRGWRLPVSGDYTHTLPNVPELAMSMFGCVSLVSRHGACCDHALQGGISHDE